MHWQQKKTIRGSSRLVEFIKIAESYKVNNLLGQFTLLV